MQGLFIMRFTDSNTKTIFDMIDVLFSINKNFVCVIAKGKCN